MPLPLGLSCDQCDRPACWVELGVPCIRSMYDGRADEGHDDVFVSAVVEAELGQRQAKGVEDGQDVG